MSNSKVFARRLKEEREKRGWTQEYMAGLLQIKIGTLSGYERNYRTPDLDMVTKIANLLGVSVDYLLGRDRGEDIPWWEKDSPPAAIELDKFIRSQPNLRLFGDPMSEDVKDDVMLALRAAWEVLKKERAAKKQPEGQ
ncbi:MAG TPA: helix-turn-helix transcriptional regulator [Bacillota bacterium]|nr:helix-turn-helix transcriptional regulator [Bacillota bacterium]HQD77158.1 helix-turn-helix transcriptional regulator [Bacillota bacterium]HUM58327.1 helix-turn-helix transcriptional regulator [Bacillota bacterium]